jgi:hypothetical protein
MSQSFDILRRIQEYEVPPPPEVVASLQTALNEVRNSSSDPVWNGCLERLAHLELLPPPSVRSSIKKMISPDAALPNIRPQEGKAGSGSIRKIFSPYVYRPVAACILLVIAVWAIRSADSSHKPVHIAVTQRATPAPVNNQGQAVAPVSDTLTEKSLAKNVSSLPDSGAGPGSNMIRVKENPSFSVEGRYLPVPDNDLLFTLTSFKYDELPAFIGRKDDKDVKIHVDAYSNIYVSKSMLQMIKEMYEVKSGGKPTRKARRDRAKLEQWKKKDEARFDQSTENNPLDPIDLARFIFR